jgi:hypothetical protein
MFKNIQVVVDSNFLDNDKIIHYLEHSPHHRLILSEPTLIEIFKNNAIRTAESSFKILSNFSDQVFVLRPTHQWLNEVIESEEDLAQLVDNIGTEEVRKICRGIVSSKRTDEFYEIVSRREAGAAEYMSILASQIPAMESAIKLEWKDIHSADRKIISKGGNVSSHAKHKIRQLIDDTAKDFILSYQNPGRVEPLPRRDAINMFAFRYAICVVVYFTIRVQKDMVCRGEGKAINDVMDNQTAAISTFFNGLLSKDKILLTVYENARFLLEKNGAFVRCFPK